MNKLVDEAPYHPGYEDAVVPPKSAYKGIDAANMLWKPKPLTDDEILQIWDTFTRTDNDEILDFVRVLEERYGVK